MRYKIFNAETGETLATAHGILLAVDIVRDVATEGITAAIKDQYNDNVL